MKPDFTAQLRRQISFLERSCASYDSGHHEEALRIAVSLRVLFHDTLKSVSLLTHLGTKASAEVLSTFERGTRKPAAPGVLSAFVPLWIEPTGERTPPLDDVIRRDFISAEEWWSEVIMCARETLTRKDIVLAAANQDGGAHVDAQLGTKATELIEWVGTLTTMSQGQVTRRSLDNHHFPLLRQFAHEVLNSPDINRK
jgi:hypothetical protein